MPHRAVGEPRQLDEHHRPGGLVLAVVRQSTAAVDLDGDVQLLTHPPERVVVGLPQAGQPTVGRDGRQEHTGQERERLLGPAHLGHGVLDAVDEDLDDRGPTTRGGGAEVGAPAIVGLQARPAPVVVLLGGRQGDQVPLGEEGRDRVGEEDLGHDAVGLGLLQAAPGVPAAVGGRGHEVGEGIDVGRGPGVEVVVPLRGQVVPVLVELGPGVAVRGDDGIARGHRNSITLAVLRPAGFAISVIRRAAPLRCAASPMVTGTPSHSPCSARLASPSPSSAELLRSAAQRHQWSQELHHARG